MPGSFTVQFFDLMVYVMPGTIVLLGVLARHKGAALERLDRSQHIAHYVFFGFIAAFAAGFVIHLFFSVSLGGADRIAGSRRLERMLNSIPEIGIAEAEAQKFSEVQLPDRMAFFRYAESIVDEELPIRAATASRLEALALFSRNSIPAVVAFALLAIGPAIRKRPLLAQAGALIGLLLMVTLLWHGYLVFSKNSAKTTIRSFIAWCEINHLPSSMEPDGL